MPNAIKYSALIQDLALKKGNFWIGTGDVPKGPTEDTDYWNGISPPAGGYTIYLNKPSGGPSIYIAADDTTLISLTNTISGQTFATTQQCFNYYYGETDKLLVNQDYPSNYPYIVMDGLVLNLDASITQSYPGSGNTWTDVNGLGPKNNGTLTNGPTFNPDNGGSIVFDGVNDSIFREAFLNVGNNFSIFSWIKPGNINVRNGIVGNSYPYSAREGFYFATATNYGGVVDSFFISVGNDIAYRTASNNSITRNVWNYVSAVVTNGGQDIKLYVNGAETTYRGGILSTGTVTYNTNQFYIGNRFNNTNEPFAGNIAQTLVYNRTLTAQEVLQNYNATKSRYGL